MSEVDEDPDDSSLLLLATAADPDEDEIDTGTGPFADKDSSTASDDELIEGETTEAIIDVLRLGN